MVKKLPLILFYLLIFLLPTQLGKHFFFDFSLINGIRSDYLAPTLFLTDVIILCLFFSFFIGRARIQFTNTKHEFQIFLLVIFYLLFNSIIIATNKWVAFYKLTKVVEFVLLGYAIVKLKPKTQNVLTLLSMGVTYSGVIALLQFTNQRSVGGLLYFLGERSFTVVTPGIAKFSFFSQQFLRPYATFPHPNVLGGFMAVVLPLLLYSLLSKRGKDISNHVFFWVIGLIFGVVTLVTSFSRAAWVVAVWGIVVSFLFSKTSLYKTLQRKERETVIIFYVLLFLSITVPFLTSLRGFFNFGLSWVEREELLQAGIAIITQNPVFGIGMNNFIVHVPNYLNSSSSSYIFQPIHNVYVLIAAETGLLGVLLALLGILVLYRQSLRNPILTLALIQLLLLGMFDHYLFTLQQGQLLFTLFAFLVFLKENSYT